VVGSLSPIVANHSSINGLPFVDIGGIDVEPG
jgi:hypothetical protein